MAVLRSVDFSALRQAISLEEVASRYTTLSRTKNGPCPLCGGRDRFYLHGGGERWGCRGCTPGGGDVVDLVMRVENVGAARAVEMLTGVAATPASSPRREPEGRPSKMEWRSAAWQAAALRTVSNGVAALGSGGVVSEFLTARGIDTATCDAFSIGSGFDHGRPAVVIPWQDSAGAIMAIKFRFVDERAAHDKGARFSQRAGSFGLVFGAQLVRRRGSVATLVVVEGEFNAMAIWQSARGQAVDVVSVGPQGNTRSFAQIAKLIVRRQYGRVVAWFDEPDRALVASAALPGAVPMRSPGGKDANDLLIGHGPDVLVPLIDAIWRRCGVTAGGASATESQEHDGKPRGGTFLKAPTRVKNPTKPDFGSGAENGTP